jgi:hypothetical protein
MVTEIYVNDRLTDLSLHGSGRAVDIHAPLEPSTITPTKETPMSTLYEYAVLYDPPEDADGEPVGPTVLIVEPTCIVADGSDTVRLHAARAIPETVNVLGDYDGAPVGPAAPVDLDRCRVLIRPFV